MKDCGFPYYICGGFALDIFAGKELRTHWDLDISTFKEHKLDAVEFLQSKGWDVWKRVYEPGTLGGITPIKDQNDSKLDNTHNIWAIKEGSHLVPKPRNDSTDVYDFEILSNEQTGFYFIEMVLNNRSGDDFLVNPTKGIVRQMDKAILYADGIPHLAPEVILLLKSPEVYTTHEYHAHKTPGDFRAILPLLPAESKQWLSNSLKTLFPDGLPWLSEILEELLWTK